MEKTNISLEYILDEILFYVNSSSLLNRENSVLAYHRECPCWRIVAQWRTTSLCLQAARIQNYFVMDENL
ncbi:MULTISPECIES: tRNA-dependent cyclodipeptide synthase [unclassified Bartonella]|uniref:tRNA-dependent cyclodipeptide synthase n=1 Tax=unclassified Bartonella TaxID=2645622 RepID=UPI0035CE9D94